MQQDNIMQAREARRNVDLDPNLAARTFAGTMQRASASFQTAIARNMDRAGPKFAQFMDPMIRSVDNAGELMATGRPVEAADTMMNAAINLAKSPAGLMTAGTMIAQGIADMTTATEPMDKMVGGMTAAGGALLTAANLMMNAFGVEAPSPENRFIPDTVTDIMKRDAPKGEISKAISDGFEPVRSGWEVMANQLATTERKLPPLETVKGPISGVTEIINSFFAKMDGYVSAIQKFIADVVASIKNIPTAISEAIKSMVTWDSKNNPDAPRPEDLQTTPGQAMGLTRPMPSDAPRLMNAAFVEPMAQKTLDLTAAFNLGTDQLLSAGDAAGTSIMSGLTRGGETAGSIIAGFGPQLGAAAGAAIAAAVRNAAASVTLKVQMPPTAGANTGPQVAQ